MSVCPITGRWSQPAADFYPADGPFTEWNLSDDALVRVRRQHERAAEDADFDGNRTRARRERYMANEIRLHQHQRFQLRMRYGAIDDHLGTTSYDCYVRHDEAPSYALALLMDSTRARLGWRHILTWGKAA